MGFLREGAEIPAAIVENQSLAVDTVSGATNSSNAILTAVADCVAQAGGDVEALKAVAVEKAGSLGGNAMTDFLVFGRIAGENAAKAE